MPMLRRAARQVVRVGATTAVIAGTAGAVRHHQDQRYAAKDQAAYDQQMQQQAQYDQQQQIADLQAQNAALAQQQQAMMAQQQAAAQPPQAAPPPAAAPASNPLMDQLNQLAQLHSAGVLSDEEFAAAKAKLLAG